MLTWRQRLKPLVSRVGISSSRILWERSALAMYEHKRATNPEYRAWLEGPGRQWVSDHWGTTSTADPVTWAHTASQLFELTSLLRRRLGEVDTGGAGGGWMLDAGASDGSFLSLLGIRRGVGANFLGICASKIRADGYPAVLADLERLPFGDRSFPLVVCCETLEHVPNPVAALRELDRVCSGRILLSIPWLSRTRVNSRPAGWPEVESHIFEFCEADFRKIVTHTGLMITFSSRVQVFPEPRNPLLRWWLAAWMYPSYFPVLQYYELTPSGSERRGGKQRS